MWCNDASYANDRHPGSRRGRQAERGNAQEDISFKEALNSSVRRGLDNGGSKSGKPYKVRTAKMGAQPGVNLDKALQLAGELEDEEILVQSAGSLSP